MDFINEIKKETIIICQNSYKKKFLNKNKLINIKVMSLEEFMQKFCFSYDEDAVLFTMNKYDIKYEIAKVYLKNIYYIKDKIYNNNKLDKLVTLKKELDENNLLTYNLEFKKYLKNIDIIIYDLNLDKFYIDLLSGYNYKIIFPEYENYNHKIIEFETKEEEIEYIAYKICMLIQEGIDINNIKIANADSSYYSMIERIFSLHNLKVNIPYKSKLSANKEVKKFIEKYQDNPINEALNFVNKTDPIYGQLINVLNKYQKFKNKELIINKLNEFEYNAPVYNNAINIIDYLNYVPSDNEYVFLINFNDGVIPNSYKDIEYITDNVKPLVNLNSVSEKNKILRENIINIIKSIKNLTITYKLRDNTSSYYPSTLCNLFEVIKNEEEYLNSFSETYNKMKLVRNIDKYIKYGEESKELNKLKYNFKVNYHSYKNEYTKINRTLEKLNLSYSKLQIYKKCAFRYYLTDILKLDIYEENFSTVIGQMIHYIMEKCLKENNLETETYAKEFLKGKNFTNKENFFLTKYKSEVKNLLEEVIREKEYQDFNEAKYEEKIVVKLKDNITFTGIIDKILYKEENNHTYLSLVDYKTGNEEISLNYLKDGLNIQLPIYLYLSKYLNFKNPIYCGFYLQKFNITDKDYRLVGYSNSDKDILKYVDNNYDNSKIIKGMKTNNDGSFKKYTKVLTNEEISKIIDITEKIIVDTIKDIEENKFDINPKVDENKFKGCLYCKFNDICFVKKKNQQTIKATPLEEVQ